MAVPGHKKTIYWLLKNRTSGKFQFDLCCRQQAAAPINAFWQQGGLPLFKYKDTVGRIPISTTNSWMGQPGQFSFVQSRGWTKKADPCMDNLKEKFHCPPPHYFSPLIWCEVGRSRDTYPHKDPALSCWDPPLCSHATSCTTLFWVTNDMLLGLLH